MIRILPILIVIAALSIEVGYAQGDSCDVQREVGSKALDELTWKQLNAIYEDVSSEQFDEAHDDLQNMLKRAGRDAYLQAIINQALAQIEWSRQNYDAALGYFEQALALDSLPDPAHFSLLYQIAQLYFMQERYDEALERLELWFCKSPENKITSLAYVLQASIYVRKEDFSSALQSIDSAIAMDENPRESWYQLRLAAYYELDQFPQAAETLEVMISIWPRQKMYWTQLSQVYNRLNQTGRSLAVLALAYRNDLLDEQEDIVLLAGLYRNSEVPYKAAEVLEKGIRGGVVEPSKHYWTVVADSWYAAEELEKSLGAYAEAGKVASDGEVDLRRGFILVDLERWPAAIESLSLALHKGELDDRKMGEAYLLRGMAQFNLGNYESASADWGRAGRYDKTRESARQWMNLLQEEHRRDAS